MKRRRTHIVKISLLAAALLVSACERSDEHRLCTKQWKRETVCPPDGRSKTIYTMERDEYPEATDGSCEQLPDDVTSWTDIGIFYTGTFLQELHDGLKWSAPMRWTGCAVDPSPPSSLR